MNLGGDSRDDRDCIPFAVRLSLLEVGALFHSAIAGPATGNVLQLWAASR